jgi:hypothetical protein
MCMEISTIVRSSARRALRSLSRSLARKPWERKFRHGWLFGCDIGLPLGAARLITHLRQEGKRKQLIVAITYGVYKQGTRPTLPQPQGR